MSPPAKCATELSPSMAGTWKQSTAQAAIIIIASLTVAIRSYEYRSAMKSLIF